MIIKFQSKMKKLGGGQNRDMPPPPSSTRVVYLNIFKVKDDCAHIVQEKW